MRGAFVQSSPFNFLLTQIHDMLISLVYDSSLVAKVLTRMCRYFTEYFPIQVYSMEVCTWNVYILIFYLLKHVLLFYHYQVNGMCRLVMEMQTEKRTKKLQRKLLQENNNNRFLLYNLHVL